MLNPAGERPPAEPPPGLPAPEGETDSQAAVAADSFWVVKRHGKINFLELFAGAAVASETCSEGGMAVGEPMELFLSHDLPTNCRTEASMEKDQGTGT